MIQFSTHDTLSRETISLPAPVHIAGLVLALPLALLLRRMSRRRWVHAGLMARVSTPIFSPDLSRQGGLVACAPRRCGVGAHNGIRRDCGIRGCRALV